MVNHFASLLVNLDLSSTDFTTPDFFSLAGNGGSVIVDELGTPLATTDTYTSLRTYRRASRFVSRNYMQLPLPLELSNFYEILFPSDSSDYYKEFLLYCYLQLISSTDRYKDTLVYDNRISYKLHEIAEYFKFYGNSQVSSNSKDFELQVDGSIVSSADINSATAYFNIQQLGHTNTVLVHSPTNKKYYKPGAPAHTNSANMEVVIAGSSGSPTTSSTIAIGDSGLTFTISGDLPNFTTIGNKYWSFSSTAPLVFDFTAKVAELFNRPATVDAMLGYRKDQCSSSYENLWRLHYNDVYKVTGLLLAYIERVNLIWQQKT
jgi:hypothetical protein